MRKGEEQERNEPITEEEMRAELEQFVRANFSEAAREDFEFITAGMDIVETMAVFIGALTEQGIRSVETIQMLESWGYRFEDFDDETR